MKTLSSHFRISLNRDSGQPKFGTDVHESAGCDLHNTDPDHCNGDVRKENRPDKCSAIAPFRGLVVRWKVNFASISARSE